MRMWMIDPSLLCRNHLLGEHNEIHKHRHNFVKKHKISGRIFPIVLIEPEKMSYRHEQLSVEMTRRGYNHKSPYEQPDISHLSEVERFAVADLDYNLKDLSDRCNGCRERIENKKDEK